jgi:hypothetical protein
MKIPPNLIFLAKNPDVKLCLILDFEPLPESCENCGGSGVISMFLANAGPFETPMSSKYVSKFHNGKWWTAPAYDITDAEQTMKFGTVTAVCPVCKGERETSKGPVVLPAQRPMINQLTERMSK